MANLNTTTYAPLTTYAEDEVACTISGIVSNANFASVAHSGGGSPTALALTAYANYSRSGIGATSVSYGYGISVALGFFLGAGCDPEMASSTFAGTATINPGDTCKTWITTRTFRITQRSLLTCFVAGQCRHSNIGYDGWAAVDVTMEPIWTS
jgi:hypothetical protein